MDTSNPHYACTLYKKEESELTQINNFCLFKSVIYSSVLTGLNPRRICRTRDYGIAGCDRVAYSTHYLFVGKLQNATNSGLSCSEYY
jgi:hypothetical protein